MNRVLMWAAAAMSACATSTPPPQPRESPFPGLEKLAELRVDGELESAELAVGVPVSRFELEGPGFVGVEQAELPLPWRSIYAAQADPKWLVTEAMNCAARTIAAYAAEAAGPAPLDLVDRIGPVCGTTASEVRYAVSTLDNASELDAEQIDEARRADFEARLARVPRGQVMELGFATRKAQGVVYMVAAAGRVEVRVESASLLEGTLVVEGVLETPASTVLGIVTHGALGHRDCVADPVTERPSFRLRCPVADEDEFVRLNVATAGRGEFLAWKRLDAIFSRAGVVTTMVERRSPASFDLPSPEALAEAVNAWRRRAGLSALSLERAQSALATSLAPRFFAEADDGGQPVQEQIMLGMQAGHRLEAPVVDAEFSARVLPWSSSADALIEALIEAPMSRGLVLSSDADRVAFGLSGTSSTGVAGLMVTSYVGISADSVSEVRGEVLERLNRARFARGLLPAQQVRLVRKKAMLEQVVQREASVGALVDDYLRQSTSSFPGRVVSVVSQEFHDVKRWQPAPELVEPATLQVDLDVAIYRPLGATWWTYLVVASCLSSS